MFNEGRISFFRNVALPQPEGVLCRLLDCVGASEGSSASLSQGISQEWEAHLGDKLPGLQPDAGFWQHVPVKELPKYLKLPQCLTVLFPYPPLGKRVFEGLKQSIPVAVFGEHLPSEVILKVGPHDLLAVNPDSELYRIARPFISLTLWGYHSPLDAKKYEEAVLRNPVFQQVRKEIGAIMGGAEMAISYL
jgi:hypothetical protein